MWMSWRHTRLWMAALLAVAALGAGSVARADMPVFLDGVFGLGVTASGDLLAADAGAGIYRMGKQGPELVLEIPFATAVKALGNGQLFVLQTGLGDPTDPNVPGRILYRVINGVAHPLADLGAFELAEDPDGHGFDSNPWDLAVVNGNEILVVDAGGNSLIRVNARGQMELVASFPSQMVQNPFAPPGVEMPAEAVPTSVVVGRDGHYYVGELTGFPGTPGVSRVWRIERGTVGAECGTDPACSVVGTEFTSIIDLAIGRDGTLYVAEMDENGWLVFEGFGDPVGGAVHECNVGATLSCTKIADGLPELVAIELVRGQLYASINALQPGAAAIIQIP